MKDSRLRDSRFDAVDAHLYGGGVLLAVGCGLVNLAYGLIALGLFLLWQGARIS